MTDAEHFTTELFTSAGMNVSSARDRDGPAADATSPASSRLQMIDPASWPTNNLGILAQYDAVAECFRLAPPHEWASDEIPFDVIKGKGKGKGKTFAPIPDLLP